MFSSIETTRSNGEKVNLHPKEIEVRMIEQTSKSLGYATKEEFIQILKKQNARE